MHSGTSFSGAALAAGVMVSMPMAQATEPLQSRLLLDGKVTMLVPQNLKFMSDADKRERYPGRNAPAYVLTNEDWSVNLAFDLKQVPMKPAEVGELEKPMLKQLSGAKINSSAVRKINGVDFLVIDADMDMPDDARLHNLITVTSLEGRMLVISYNCLLNFDPACASIGPKMMQSIVLKPKVPAK
jgi:hypothetical protein